MSAVLVVIILGIVQGITEFLPVSSTGHMILVEKFMKSGELSPKFLDSFLVIVQLASILAVLLYFWKDIHPFVKERELFQKRMSLWSKIVVGVIPVAIIGLKFDDVVSNFFMDNVVVIAVALIFYGLAFLWIEKKMEGRNPLDGAELTYRAAFLMGCFQCLALVPGTSRSGSTILGGLILGLSRPIAAEFSFLMAIPVMFGASLLKVVKNGLSYTPYEWQLMGIGSLVSFVVAYVVIKWFMEYIRRRNFNCFGVYRIILGVTVLLLMR